MVFVSINFPSDKKKRQKRSSLKKDTAISMAGGKPVGVNWFQKEAKQKGGSPKKTSPYFGWTVSISHHL